MVQRMSLNRVWQYQRHPSGTGAQCACIRFSGSCAWQGSVPQAVGADGWIALPWADRPCA